MAADTSYQPAFHVKQGGLAVERASGRSFTADSGLTVSLNGAGVTTANVGTAGTVTPAA